MVMVAVMGRSAGTVVRVLRESLLSDGEGVVCVGEEVLAMRQCEVYKDDAIREIDLDDFLYFTLEEMAAIAAEEKALYTGKHYTHSIFMFDLPAMSRYNRRMIRCNRRGIGLRIGRKHNK